MSCSNPSFWKSFQIAMEYMEIGAIKSMYECIFHGWFLGIFKDKLVQSLFFFSKNFLFTSTGFSTQWMHPSLQQSEAGGNSFF